MNAVRKWLWVLSSRHLGAVRVLSAVAALAVYMASSRAEGVEKAPGWAFRPLQKPALPDGPAGTNPIDLFVRGKLRQRGWDATPRATAAVLLRRLTMDITGLPPSPVDVEAFTRGFAAEAWETWVDQQLNSPQYGERWARHWLDLVRYADTGGFEKDMMFPLAWHYRDYVIRSFNANKPFDRFIEEQVAGDELWPDDPEARAATGLYAVGPVSLDSALSANQIEYEWLTDTVDTTGAAFLGLTVGCARCHDHKYDPITQADYYGLQAIFAASDRPFPKDVREARLKGLNGILADVPIPKEALNDPRCTIVTDDKADAQLFHRTAPLEVRRLQRGELSKPREAAEPALPAVFRAQREFDPSAVSPNSRRAILARWLVARDNPLTARVLVNRIWAWHFGQGLVRTPNDFGAQGETPTHPELLDWLAADFIEHGWDLKRLHRLILTSATYQMRSAGGLAAAAKADPENRLLAHFSRRRLDAEAIWDAMHFCAGTLNLKSFGPPVVPPLTRDELSGLFGDEKWKPTREPAEAARRGVYLFERRTFFLPILDAFDPPDNMASCPRRFETIVPTQALALLNSRVAQEQAREFARRLLRECGPDADQIAAQAWRVAFGRRIDPGELARIRSFLNSSEAHAPTENVVTAFCLAIFNMNEFAFVD